ncbi:MAG: hypothetical protein CMO01_00790, partial [Thalassobius sp.]|nr:hypothetical protein [Thalassovita sp.]
MAQEILHRRNLQRGAAGLPRPLQSHAGDPVERRGLCSVEVVECEDLRKEGGIRRMRITKDLLDVFGYTENCEGCRRKRADMKE